MTAAALQSTYVERAARLCHDVGLDPESIDQVGGIRSLYFASVFSGSVSHLHSCCMDHSASCFLAPVPHPPQDVRGILQPCKSSIYRRASLVAAACINADPYRALICTTGISFQTIEAIRVLECYLPEDKYTTSVSFPETVVLDNGLELFTIAARYGLSMQRKRE